MYIQHRCKQPVTMQPALKMWKRPWIGFKWLFFRRGEGASNHFEAGGFVRSNDDVAYPNLMFHFLPIAIRYDGSARGQPRVATSEVEVEGQRIRAGDLVMVVVNAANRDPRRFAEPERFDITRGDTGHLAFASGIHFCLGAALARMEVAVAFRKIAQLTVRFELDTDDLTYKRSHGRNLVALPVRLVPAS